MNCPAVSIVCTAFRESRDFFSRHIDSVLAQTFRDFEYILVLEPGDEQTLSLIRIVDDSRVRVHINERPLGFVASLNIGLKLARGPYVARLDSDDFAAIDRLEKQYDFLQAHPDVDVLGSAASFVDERGVVFRFQEYPADHDRIALYLQHTCPLAHPSIMCRKAALTAVGGYDESLAMNEDLDLWLRLARAGSRFANLREPLLNYRVLEGNARKYHSLRYLRSLLRVRLKNFERTTFSAFGVVKVFAILLLHVAVTPRFYALLGEWRRRARKWRAGSDAA